MRHLNVFLIALSLTACATAPQTQSASSEPNNWKCNPSGGASALQCKPTAADQSRVAGREPSGQKTTAKSPAKSAAKAPAKSNKKFD